MAADPLSTSSAMARIDRPASTWRRGLVVAGTVMVVHLLAWRLVMSPMPRLNVGGAPLPVLQVRLLPREAARVVPRTKEPPAEHASAVRPPRPTRPARTSPPTRPVRPSRSVSRQSLPPSAAQSSRSPSVAPAGAPIAAPAASPAASPEVPAMPTVPAVPGPPGPGAPGAQAAAVEATQPLYGRPLLEPARSGSIVYRIYNQDYASGQSLAQLVFTFEQRDGRYRLSTRARALGMTALLYSGTITQTSAGRIGDDGLMPDTYSEQRGDRTPRTIALDPATRIIQFGSGPVPAPAGMQDRLSSLMQLSLLARTRPDLFKPGSTLWMPELTFSDVAKVGYRTDGYVVLPTPSGLLNAIHLTRLRPDKPDEPSIEIWLGYDQMMLPVRIRVIDAEGRGTLDQLIEHYDATAAP